MKMKSIDKNSIIRTVKIALKIFLGLFFIFSGFVKSIDPLGYTYKIEDYFSAFGTFFELMNPIAFPLAIGFSTFELVLGFCFLFNIKTKLTTRSSFFFILVMLLITLFIALTNSVSDCGCFGDALVLSNWQTFYKNIVILLIIITLLMLNNNKSFLSQHFEWSLIIIFTIIGISISIYSYRNLPLIDFRPYKIGINILKGMEIPEDKPADKYETTLIYEKNGKQQKFTIENYPKDEDWTFVSQETVLVKKGYTPPIHDFSIINTNNGDDLTDLYLNYQGTVNIIVMYDLKLANTKGIETTKQLYAFWQEKNTPFIALTGSTIEQINTFKRKYNIQFPIFNTDPITLKTIVRSNPGLMIIKNGTIVGKWHWRNFINQ